MSASPVIPTVHGWAALALLSCSALVPARTEAQSIAGEDERSRPPALGATSTVADTPSTFTYEPLLDSYPDGSEVGGPGWIEANERVAGIGGWRSYAREREGVHGSDPISTYLHPPAEDDADDAFDALSDTLDSASDARRFAVRRAWVDAVAAAQRLDHVEKLRDSAEATSEMARRMESVGNLNRLTRARAEVRHVDATILLADARFEALAARERLGRSLGLDRRRLTALELPRRLPDVPLRPRPPDCLEATSRRAESKMPASSRASWRSNLRESYLAYRTSHEIATLYRETILPLRATISEEHAYQYGSMLVGVFDLLADSRDSIRAVLRAIEASRQFWQADAALQAWSSGVPSGVEMSNLAGDEDERRDAH